MKNIKIIKSCNVLDKNKMVIEFLKIAKSTSFSTDYEDMHNHIFGNENLNLCIVEESGICGFATYLYFPKHKLVYIQGLIINSNAQSRGTATNIIKRIIKETKCKYVMCRTHNPRVYELCEGISKKIHPNLYEWCINDRIKEIISLIDDTKYANDKLIVKNAYQDEKVQQKTKNEYIFDYFCNLGKKDAQVIIIES